MPVVTPLTYEEHRDLGREMTKTRTRLQHLGSVVESVYGPQSLPAFQFKKLNAAMQKACEELQAQADKDCPGLDASTFYQ